MGFAIHLRQALSMVLPGLPRYTNHRVPSCMVHRVALSVLDQTHFNLIHSKSSLQFRLHCIEMSFFLFSYPSYSALIYTV